MKVAFRNFFRNKAVNLTMRSVRYFLPDAEFYCVSFFKKCKDEYDKEESLDPCIKNTYLQTEYVINENKPTDHSDDRLTSGFANRNNGVVFAEGYNAIYNLFKDSEEKVLILAEDHLFTSGAVLKELVENDFDVALAPWDYGYNGSILAFRPSKVHYAFPIDIKTSQPHVEALLLKVFGEPTPARRVDRLPKAGVDRTAAARKFSKPPDSRALVTYLIKNRYYANYFGDGFYTNSSAKIKKAVDKLYKDGPFNVGSNRGVNTNIEDKL